MIFVGNSVRSEGLIAANAELPVNISDTDLTDGVQMGIKRKRVHQYRRKVIALSTVTDSVKQEDLVEIDHQDIAAEIAGVIPDNVAVIGINEIAIAIQNLTATVATLDSRMATLSAKMFNSSAHSDEDLIIPPMNANDSPLPAGLPRTIHAIRNMDART